MRIFIVLKYIHIFKNLCILAKNTYYTQKNYVYLKKKTIKKPQNGTFKRNIHILIYYSLILANSFAVSFNIYADLYDLFFIATSKRYSPFLLVIKFSPDFINGIRSL